jgi:hypothetical protein
MIEKLVQPGICDNGDSNTVLMFIEPPHILTISWLHIFFLDDHDSRKKLFIIFYIVELFFYFQYYRLVSE